MTALQDCLSYLADQPPLGTVVHIHPSEPDIVDRYAALGACRVVLVSADPDALPGLRRLIHGRPWLTIVERVVAPESGFVQWQRYNVALLNGLLAAGAGLQQFYPRLQREESLSVEALSLQALLDDLQVDRQAGANMLVLETPGIEDRLLEHLPPERLGLFNWLLLRGAQPGLLVEGADPGVTIRSLETRAWRRAQHSADEPLWPVTLLQFDAAAAERVALRQQIADIEAERRSLIQAKTAAEQHSAESGARAEALNEAKVALETMVVEHREQIRQLNKDHEDAVALAEKRSKRIDELTRDLKERDVLVEQLRYDLQKTAATFKAELSQAKAVAEQHVAARAKALNEAKLALEKMVVEHREQIRQMGKDYEDAVGLAEKRSKRIDELARDLKERDVQVEQLRSDLQTAVQSRTALEARVTELSVRQRMVDEEMFKADGQIALIRDVLLRESGL